MKKVVSIFLIICFTISFCSAQVKSAVKSNKIPTKSSVEHPATYVSPGNPSATKGTIKATEASLKAGMEYTYTYQPPKNLLIPNNLQALVLFLRNGTYHSRSVPVVKKGIGYQFAFKAPDSVSALVMGMVDGDKIGDDMNGLVVPTKEVVDNNNNSCFTFYLHDAKNKLFGSEKVSQAILLRNYAIRYLDIEPDNTYILNLFEDAYKLHPELREEDSYFAYLRVLYKVKKEAVKDKLLANADECLAQHDETKWRNAADIYDLLQMSDEAKSIENKILSSFKDGQLARDKFWSSYYGTYSTKDTTEESVLASMSKYFEQFKNSPSSEKTQFYFKIISLAFDKRDWATYWKYMALDNDKYGEAYANNKNALKLSGEKLDDKATDLSLAKLLSGQALTAAKDRLDNAVPGDDYYEEFQSAYFRYANTYALILYKSGQYDSAFYYQDMLYRLGSHFDVERIANYAAYIEKVKGIAFARSFIEENLLKGVRSPTMLKQLQRIYKELNLPDDTFIRMRDYNKTMVKKKYNDAVFAKYGALMAKGFALKNLKEEVVSLSSLRNKVVVIDFWATWCIPCKASFPAMQKLADKYKGDTSVVFLFIDVWENKPFQKMKEAAAKLMTEGEYNFTVLLDTENKVVTDYRVLGIPAKFVVDKNGNLIYMGEEIGDMSIIIEAAKE